MAELRSAEVACTFSKGNIFVQGILAELELDPGAARREVFLLDMIYYSETTAICEFQNVSDREGHEASCLVLYSWYCICMRSSNESCGSTNPNLQAPSAYSTPPSQHSTGVLRRGVHRLGILSIDFWVQY